MINFCPPGTPITARRALKNALQSRRVYLSSGAGSSTVRGVTEPDATGPFPAATGPDDAPPHAGRVVRRVLLRRNIVIDAETAQLVVTAVQAALRAGAPSGAAGPRVPAAGGEPLS
jgi:hypothetical protein